MIAYIDSSVLLRIVLKAPDPLPEWDRMEAGFSSELLRVEVRRSLDRLWLHHLLTQEELAEKTTQATALLRGINVADLTQTVLERAAQPLPTPLGTLDALHLATAVLLRDSRPADAPPILFATHDHELARAAKAMHFEVLGA